MRKHDVMKIGFSSLACPNWNLDTMIANAAELGFDGIELRGLGGELHLPSVPELARDPDQVRRKFADGNVELVCLGTCASLSSCRQREIERHKATITEFVELAGKLGCPYVRVFAGEVDRFDNQRLAVSRVAAEFASLVPLAERHDVTLLVENGGGFPGSDALWFIVDVAGHPAVQACWNQCQALTVGERPTISIPRLSSRTSVVHICDADFDGQGLPIEHKLPGQGHAEVARQIELLKGLAYDGYLIFEWPKLSIASLPDPEKVLPTVATFMRECVDAEQAVLSAYKADKRKVKLASRVSASESV